MSVAIVIILDTRRIKGNNKYPVKLRVNFKRVTNYYQTTFDLTEQDYKKLSASRISADLQNIKSKLKEIERQAESEIKEIVPFNFIDFEEKYISNNPFFRERKIKKKLISEFFDDFEYSPFLRRFSILSEKDIAPGTIAWSYKEYIKRLLKEGRIGIAVNYKCSYVSLKKFQGNFCFSAITIHFLTAYENKLKSEGVSKSTIGLYLRPLRAVFNEANEEGPARKDKSYPFGKRKYQIPTSQNIKKALELDDVKQIYYYDTNLLAETEQRSRDYWLFSYFGNGMNAKDVACFRCQNIHDDYIVFERAKTERLQRSNPKPIIVNLNEDMKNIIQRWGNKLSE